MEPLFPCRRLAAIILCYMLGSAWKKKEESSKVSGAFPVPTHLSQQIRPDSWNKNRKFSLEYCWKCLCVSVWMMDGPSYLLLHHHSPTTATVDAFVAPSPFLGLTHSSSHPSWPHTFYTASIKSLDSRSPPRPATFISSTTLLENFAKLRLDGRLLQWNTSHVKS